MTGVVALANIALGWVYVSYGILTLVDMKRGWKAFGFSHFGAAWTLMAFTCGPHHLDHGLHVWQGRSAGPLDLVAVLAGYPAGVAFVYLRVEAFFGGRGDRFVGGSPLWVRAMPVLSVIYVTALVSSLTDELGGPLQPHFSVVLNGLLVAIYLAISFFLLRTQIHNRAILGGWSLSGLSLGTVFWTCAMMHVVTLTYTASGRYDTDIHGLIIDTVGVPAGLYFLWVVWGLYRDAIGDWNRGARSGHPLVAGQASRRAAA